MADGAWRRFSGIRRAHDLPIPLNHILPLQNHGHDGSRRHVLRQTVIEGPLPVDMIEGSAVFPAQLHHLPGHNVDPGLFKTRDDLPD